MKKKYRYNIGDVVLLSNDTFGKVAIVVSIPGPGPVYEIYICGLQETLIFWECEIEEKI